jgi:hypothetical protein
MPITIIYKMRNVKLKKAADLANEMLASEELIRVVKSRTTPFDDSKPASLSPAKVAGFIKNSNLQVRLCHYTNENAAVGGMFSTATPKQIHANRNAIPVRSVCSLARMLVHECIHALSYDVPRYDFSHDRQSPSANRNTAPYWIQAKLKPYCTERFGVPEGEVEDVIEVEVSHGQERLADRRIRCK